MQTNHFDRIPHPLVGKHYKGTAQPFDQGTVVAAWRNSEGVVLFDVSDGEVKRVVEAREFRQTPERLA